MNCRDTYTTVRRETRERGKAARPSVSSRSGFTLVEAVVASAMVLLIAGGLYAAALMAIRTAHFNRLSVAARALASQRLEEIAAEGIGNILQQIPYSPRTNRMEVGYEADVVTSVDAIAHAADYGVATNVDDSAYIEVHVHAAYRSPFTGQEVTNHVSAMVR